MLSTSDIVKKAQKLYEDALLLAKDEKMDEARLKLLTESYELDKNNFLTLQEKIKLTLKKNPKADIKKDLSASSELKKSREEFFDEHMKKEYKLGQEVAFRGYQKLKAQDYVGAEACFTFVITKTGVDSLLTKCLFLRAYGFLKLNDSTKSTEDFKKAMSYKNFQNVIPKDVAIKTLILLRRIELLIETNQPAESFLDLTELLNLYKDNNSLRNLFIRYINKLETKASSFSDNEEAIIYRKIAQNCLIQCNSLSLNKTQHPYNKAISSVTKQIESIYYAGSNELTNKETETNQKLQMEKASEAEQNYPPELHIDLTKQLIPKIVNDGKEQHYISEKYFNLSFLPEYINLYQSTFELNFCGQFKKALATQEKMLEIFPYDYRARTILAKAYQDNKNLDSTYQLKAIHHYTQAIALTPHHHAFVKRTYLGRGIVNFELKRYQEAKKDLLAGMYTGFNDNMEIDANQKKNIYHLLPELERQLNPGPKSNQLQTTTILEYYLKKAEDHYSHSQHQAAFEELFAYQWIAYYLCISAPSRFFQIARSVYVQLGHIDTAVTFHRGLINAGAKEILKYSDLIGFVTDKARDIKSLSECEIMSNKQNIFGADLFERGKEYIGLNNFPKALECFNAAVNLLFTEAKVYIDRGVVYAMMGQKEKAIADYKTALSIEPNNNRAKRNLKFLTEVKKTKNEATITPNELNENKIKEILPPLKKTTLKFHSTKSVKIKKVLLTEDEKAQFNYAESVLKDLTQTLKVEEQKKLKEYISNSNKGPSPASSSAQNKKTSARRKQKHLESLTTRKKPAEKSEPKESENTTASQPIEAKAETIRYCLPGRYPMYDFEQAIICRLKMNGADAYLTGSSVPARIKGIILPGADSDIHTTATPEEIEYLLADLNIYPTNKKGLYKLIMPSGYVVEIFSNPTRSHTATILALELNELGEASTTCKTAYDDLMQNPFLRLTCDPIHSYDEDPQRVLINIYNAIRTEKLLPASLQEAMVSYAPKLLKEDQLIPTNLKLQKYFNSFHCYDIYKSFFETKDQKGENVISKLFPHVGERLNKNAPWILNEIALMKKNPEAAPMHFIAIFIVSAWMEQRSAHRPETLYDIIHNEPLFAIQSERNQHYIKDLLELTEPLVISWKKAFLTSKSKTQLTTTWDPRLMSQSTATATSAGTSSQNQLLKKAGL